MNIRAGWSTPLLHVVDVELSLGFYTLVGFETVDVHLENGLAVWARAHCEGGAVMFLRVDDDDEAGETSRTVLYMYTPDLAGLKAQLDEAGIETGTIRHPSYMPSGEICLSDPDGNVILVAHWGDREHGAWLRDLEEKRRAGNVPRSTETA